MVSFPNAKINLGLNIISKRSDGFHDLETVFFPVNIKDALEIIQAKNLEDDIVFSSSGNAIDVSAENNICLRAYRLLKKDFPFLPSIKMHLHKNIPMGAGLGGGSSDAAAVLRLLTEKFLLGISNEKLKAYAASLGSDCAFFIDNKTALAKGRGELLSEIPVDLSAYKIMIVYPNIHVSTAHAFSHLNNNRCSPAGELEQVLKTDISNWKGLLKNDFEGPVFHQHPVLKEIKETIYANGAAFSGMSGSGSSIYGIFPAENLPDIKFPSHWFCKTV